MLADLWRVIWDITLIATFEREFMVRRQKESMH